LIFVRKLVFILFLTFNKRRALITFCVDHIGSRIKPNRKKPNKREIKESAQNHS
jgi:hypothetical protein